MTDGRAMLAATLALCGTFAAATSAHVPTSAPIAAAVVPVAVFGADDRRRLDPRRAGLAGSIGLLFNNEARTVCTAFCVGDDLVATAGHCVTRANSGLKPDPAGTWFRSDIDGKHSFARIKGAEDGSATQNIMLGGAALRLRPPIDATGDWAVVRLSDSVCRGAVLPLAVLGPDELAAAAEAGTMLQVSFHRDFKEWELAEAVGCEIGTAFDDLKPEAIRSDFKNVDGLVLHRCDTGEASSGSPLLLDRPGGPAVVAINIGTYVQSRLTMKDGKAADGAKPRTLANTAIDIGVVAGSLEAMRGEEIAATVEDIRQFQRRLRALAIYAGPADGIFNDLTRIAIREFERAHGLPQTGLPTAANARRLLGEPPLPEHGATQEGVGAAD